LFSQRLNPPIQRGRRPPLAVHRDAFNGALQQQRPLLANRASPKRPTDQSIPDIDAIILLGGPHRKESDSIPSWQEKCYRISVHALAYGRGDRTATLPFWIRGQKRDLSGLEQIHHAGQRHHRHKGPTSTATEAGSTQVSYCLAMTKTLSAGGNEAISTPSPPFRAKRPERHHQRKGDQRVYDQLDRDQAWNFQGTRPNGRSRHGDTECKQRHRRRGTLQKLQRAVDRGGLLRALAAASTSISRRDRRHAAVSAKCAAPVALFALGVTVALRPLGEFPGNSRLDRRSKLTVHPLIAFA